MPAPVYRSASNKSVGVASTTWPLTKPSGAATGDLIIVCATFAAPTITGSISGTGWHGPINDTNFLSTFRLDVWWKVEDGAAIGTVSWDGSSVLNGGIVMCYDCSATGFPAIVENFSALSTPGAGNPTTPNIVVRSVADRTLLVLPVSDTDETAAAATGFVRQTAVNAAAGLDRIPASVGNTTVTCTGGGGNQAAMSMVLAAPRVEVNGDYSLFPKRVMMGMP